MAQFVPVKIDVDTPEYAQWRQDHSSEGNTIPKLYVVRADDATLYGRSGSLQGRDLPDMLVRALQNSGRILSLQEVNSLNKAADEFVKLKQQGDIDKAINAINRVRKIGDPGNIASYSASAMRVNELVTTTATEIKIQLSELATQMKSEETEAKLGAILGYLKIRREFGGLKIIKSDLAEFQKKYTTKGNSQLTREARIIDTATIADTKSKKTRAKEKLQELISKSKIEAVKSLADRTLEALNSTIE